MKQILRCARPATSAVRGLQPQPQSQSSILQQTFGARKFHNSTTRWQEKSKDSEKDSLSFRGQLYESTADRLKRERANEARYIQATRSRRAGEGWTFALSVGKRNMPLVFFAIAGR